MDNVRDHFKEFFTKKYDTLFQDTIDPEQVEQVLQECITICMFFDHPKADHPYEKSLSNHKDVAKALVSVFGALPLVPSERNLPLKNRCPSFLHFWLQHCSPDCL